MSKDLVKLGALWTGKDKDGQPMLTGTVNSSTRILILKNGFKREEKHPDYLVYLAPADQKDKDGKEESDDSTPF
jgi:hypothetical protein